MPGITGMGTTYNLPNYVGELFAVTPEDTPFLSAIGGLTGGRPANATHFTWSGYDLRDAATDRQRVEGADAPTAEARARFAVMNVVEIHQETVSTSYTKQAATGQFGDIGAANPNVQGVSGANAVTNEHGWQVTQALKQIARDVEATFVAGTFQDPTTNATPRRTRGLLEAITTNAVDANDGTADQPLTEDMVLNLMQDVWTSGGISESETATIMANAWQKRQLTKIFITDRGFQEQTRNVGGVNLQTIETDFGRLNIMLHRYMPANSLAVASLEQCAPRFLPIPGKGFLFQEELAKTGSAERTQIYGEIGLEYGNERAHGKITGLATTAAAAAAGTLASRSFAVTGFPNTDQDQSDQGDADVEQDQGDGAPKRPAKTARREDWEAYILATYDVDPSEVADMTKAQLQELAAE
ncbi:SU10 major capsid protein [Nocardiopsis synnemataformans]|uniref:SU10 major capsid protein n=1 Tax=Nocardiopsis synnemataformans TaxID=61305 RepID=UPI003EBB2BEE